MCWELLRRQENIYKKPFFPLFAQHEPLKLKKKGSKVLLGGSGPEIIDR
jgi:hypothetical protein